MNNQILNGRKCNMLREPIMSDLWDYWEANITPGKGVDYYVNYPATALKVIELDDKMATFSEFDIRDREYFNTVFEFLFAVKTFFLQQLCAESRSNLATIECELKYYESTHH